MPTHYDVLGITADASPDSVKRAYYKRARAYYPDAHAGSASELIHEAERAMAAVNTAWTVLRDPGARLPSRVRGIARLRHQRALGGAHVA